MASFSSSSPSCFSVCASCIWKENTIYKKAEELSTLCGIDVCLICYDSNNNLTFWPANQPQKLKDMAERFIELPETARRNCSVSARDILQAKGTCIFGVDPEDNPNLAKEKRQKTIKSSTSRFTPDDYSSQRLKEVLLALQLKLGSIDEPKPIKEDDQQQQQQLSEPILTNQDWCNNPNLVLTGEECAAIMRGEDPWNQDFLDHQQQQELSARNQDLASPLVNEPRNQDLASPPVNIEEMEYSYYLFGDKEDLAFNVKEQETLNQDLYFPINSKFEDIDISMFLQDLSKDVLSH